RGGTGRSKEAADRPRGGTATLERDRPDRGLARQERGGPGPEERPAGRRNDPVSHHRPDGQPPGPDCPSRADGARRVQRGRLPAGADRLIRRYSPTVVANTTRNPTFGSRALGGRPLRAALRHFAAG